MAKVRPYHTNSAEYPPEHRMVHHNQDDCPDGKRIEQGIASTATAESRSARLVNDLRSFGNSVLISTTGGCKQTDGAAGDPRRGNRRVHNERAPSRPDAA